MSLEVLDTVYRQPDFRQSINASEKKRIRNFVSNCRHKRFTLHTFRHDTRLGKLAAPFLDSVVKESTTLSKTISPDAHVFLLRKTTIFFCPSENHDRLILEPDEDDNGWCYICEKSYPLGVNLESEIRYVSNIEDDATIQTQPASLKSNIESRWRALPSPLRWLILVVLAAFIGIPITVTFTPPVQRFLWPPDTTPSPTDYHDETAEQTNTALTPEKNSWTSVNRASIQQTPFSNIHTLPDATAADLTTLTVELP